MLSRAARRAGLGGWEVEADAELVKRAGGERGEEDAEREPERGADQGGDDASWRIMR
jgi:hypothetical protein